MKMSIKVVKVMQAEKISPEEMAYMVSHSAISSMRGCNRRYFHWLFKIENEVLKDMQHVQMLEIGKGQTRMFEEHGDCSGKGCRGCGWVGQIGRWVTDKPIPKHQPLHFA